MIGTKAFSGTKRLYSSTISQDFLKNVLERVKETAARKPVARAPNPKNRGPRGPRDGSGKREAKFGSQNNNGRDQNKNLRRNDGPVTSRLNKPRINANVVNRQPQFKRRTAGPGSPQAADENLLDALQSVQTGRGQKDTSGMRRGRAPRTTQRSVPGLNQSPASNEDIIAQAKKAAVSQRYVPDEPTPLSLLKYSPNLAHSASCRMSSYGLSVLSESDFPLNRELNLGVVTSPSQKAVNVSLSPESSFFGDYVPASSIMWRKERLFKNVSTTPDAERFQSSVQGAYDSLKETSEKDFLTLTKNEKKIAELLNNSKVSRLSLERSHLDLADKTLVYEVCSGLKPVSSLKA